MAKLKNFRKDIKMSQTIYQNGNKLYENHEKRLDDHDKIIDGIREDVITIKTNQTHIKEDIGELKGDIKKVETCLHASDKTMTWKLVGVLISIVLTLLALEFRSYVLG